MIEFVLSAVSLFISLVYFIVLVSSSIPQKTKAQKLKPFSVIIAAKDGTIVEKALRSLKNVKKPAIEIVVVSSDSRTLQIAKKFNAKAVRDLGIGKGAALNSAVKHASHEILYLMDEDMVIYPDSIGKLTSVVNENVVSTGYNKPSNGSSLVSFVARLYVMLLSKIQYSIYVMIGTTLASGRNTAIHKKTLRQAGGFMNSLTEDMDLSFTLFSMKKKVRFMHEVAHDQVPEKFSQYLKQQQRWNAGTGESIKRWKKHAHASDMIFLSFLLMLGLMAPLSLVFAVAGIATGHIIFFSVPLVVFLLCVSSAATLGRKDVILLPLTFIAFMFVHTFTLLYSKFRKPKGWYRTPKK